MSSSETLTVNRVQFPSLGEAVDRHVRWLLDFVRAGDLESAMVAMADVHALCSELSDADRDGD